MIIENKIRCKKCGDVLVSEHRHDYKVCKCGAVGVDGGFTYRRLIGNLEDIEDLSTIKQFKWEQAMSNLYDVLYYEGKSDEVTVRRDDLREILSALDEYSLATARYLWMLKNNKKLKE